jgi:hypothetical protein
MDWKSLGSEDELGSVDAGRCRGVGSRFHLADEQHPVELGFRQLMKSECAQSGSCPDPGQPFGDGG